jgi:aspartyl aminopeptidase
LFNHEEIGSVSTSGAESSLIPSLLNRLSTTPAALAQSISRSFLISADMGHALHPNYKSKHEEQHRPKMNGGIIIKTNAKQRYASDAVTSFIVKQLVERKGGKVQEFEVRNDMYVLSSPFFRMTLIKYFYRACGSTVGPMLSKIGLRTVDVGNAMLSMHSIRETAGSHDVQNAIDLFTSFFEGFSSLDKDLIVD